MEYFLTICAALALEGGPFFWVATHRVHHKHSDRPGDPQSPADGGFWAHAGWIITGSALCNHSPALLPHVPDLRRDKFHTWISKWHWVPITILGVALYATGRIAPYHVGSIPAHGRRTPLHLAGQFSHSPVGETSFLYHGHLQEQLLGCAADLGEGWHNNHHAHPQFARHGFAWYEFDVSWYGICTLRALGLAWDVKAPKPEFLTEANAALQVPPAMKSRPGGASL